jgi:hypothetical protein
LISLFARLVDHARGKKLVVIYLGTVTVFPVNKRIYHLML